MGISFAGRDSIQVGTSSSLTSTTSATKFVNAESQIPYVVNQGSGGTVTEVSNYNGTGQTWRIHTFNSSGTFTLTNGQQPMRYLLVGGGSPGGNACGWGGSGGSGGKVLDAQNQILTPQNYSVVVGGASTATTLGSFTSNSGVNGGGGGGGGSDGNRVCPGAGSPGPTSNVTGTNTHYAGGGGGGPANNGHCGGGGPAGAGSIGQGGGGSCECVCWGSSGGGAAGAAFVAYRTAYVTRVGF